MPKPHGHTSHCDCDACRNVPVFEDEAARELSMAQIDDEREVYRALERGTITMAQADGFLRDIQSQIIGKPTEGPFEVLPEGRSIIVSGGSNNDDLAEFFYADESTVKTTRAQALANAHLFKAAPMLLAALEALVEEWEPEESDPFWDAARAAIKAARGD